MITLDPVKRLKKLEKIARVIVFHFGPWFLIWLLFWDRDRLNGQLDAYSKKTSEYQAFIIYS